jgi:hypothetical protein
VSHVVTFYDNEAALDASVAGFLGPALAAGFPALLIATAAHRATIEAALERGGADLVGAQKAGRYRALDARSTVESFLIDGLPDPARFAATVGVVVAEHASQGPLHAYGEMVAVLWQDGNVAGALALEALWNDLLEEQPLSLLCGYAQTDLEASARICAHHDHGVGSVLWRGFEPGPASVPESRRFVRSALHDWELPGIVDAALLVVSELAGNAVRHAGGGFSVALERDAGGVRVIVQDSHSAMPRLQHSVPVGATGGRGMLLVDTLSRDWGVDRCGSGKTVWAHLAI